MNPGTRVGPYEILSPIGAGGMGEVYRARDTRLGRDVAIKVLPSSFASDPDRLRRFEQEARATGMLNHPNILAVFDVGTHQGSPYLVTELLEGRTLRDELPTPRRKALDYARQVAAGLAAAHAKGVTHRDLKPDNLFITNDGRVKILDFGLAKVAEETESDVTKTGGTTPGIAMGTVGYMSPEQALGKPADHRSDIFSFGVVLYEMLSGTRAFQRDSSIETLNAILKEDPPPLADAALELVVRRCIEKSPEQRFQSASDLGFAIQTLTGSSLTPAISGSGAVAAVPEPAKTQVGIAGSALAAVAVIAIVLGVAAGVGGVKWWQSRHPAAEWEGVQLTGSGIVYGPRSSPDGSLLAFCIVENGRGQVGLMHPGSANWSVLTHDDKHGEADFVSWSRDGSRLYFTRPDGVYSVPALGGEERLFLEKTLLVEPLPDGTFLAERLNSNREAQIFHYFPDSGKFDPLDARPITNAFRASPDGKQFVFIGRPISNPQADVEAQVFDLASGKMRMIAPRFNFAGPSVDFTPDGKSLLAVEGLGELRRLVEIPLDGAPFRPIASATKAMNGIDSAPDGTIYVDQVERPTDVLRFPATGGAPEFVAQVYAGNWSPVALPDGRVIFVSAVAGRETVMVGSPGKNPVPFVDTEEKTGGPIGTLGPGQVIFRIGKVGDVPRKSWGVAVVSVADGRIVRRLDATVGRESVTAMSGSADGKTIFFTSQGNVYAAAVEGGEPRQLCAGDALAPNPNGQDVVVLRYLSDGAHLFRVPVNGGSEQEIPFKSNLRLNASLAPTAIRADGRLAITVVRPDSWWDEPAILNPQTGQVDKLTVPYVGDAFNVGWTPNGSLTASGWEMHSSLWRFRKKLPK